MGGPGIAGALAGVAQLLGTGAATHLGAEAASCAALRALSTLQAARGPYTAPAAPASPPTLARGAARPGAAPPAAGAAPPQAAGRRAYSARFSDADDDKAVRPTTPWVRQVISGVDLMRHPKYNKGLAFSEAERDRLYLRGLLPPAVLSQEVQLERAILNIRSKDDALGKYSYLQSLQNRNERLFYRWGGAVSVC
jgi:hypothetical protein